MRAEKWRDANPQNDPDMDGPPFDTGSLEHGAKLGPYAILGRIGSGVRANYDVSPDGQRFLMLKPVEQKEAPLTQINVVLNWTEELKRLVPTH